MLKKPRRVRDYNIILFHTLEEIMVASKGIPKAIEVLDFWRAKKPAQITEVGYDYFKYLDHKSNIKVVELEALNKAISRMIKESQS